MSSGEGKKERTESLANPLSTAHGVYGDADNVTPENSAGNNITQTKGKSSNAAKHCEPSWRPRNRHCAPFSGRAGVHALLWVQLPVFRGSGLFFTVRPRPQTNHRLRRSQGRCVIVSLCVWGALPLPIDFFSTVCILFKVPFVPIRSDGDRGFCPRVEDLTSLTNGYFFQAIVDCP